MSNQIRQPKVMIDGKVFDVNTTIYYEGKASHIGINEGEEAILVSYNRHTDSWETQKSKYVEVEFLEEEPVHA